MAFCGSTFEPKIPPKLKIPLANFAMQHFIFGKQFGPKIFPNSQIPLSPISPAEANARVPSYTKITLHVYIRRE